MPMYFFHCVDGTREFDSDGVQLEDDAAARLAAMEFAGEIMRDEPGKIWSDGHWRVEVTDPENVVLFTVSVEAAEGPPAS